MKRFNQLTETQQKAAISYAASKLHSLMLHGFLFSNRELSRDNAMDIATVAAQDVWYVEKSDIVVEGIADLADVVKIRANK